MNDKERSRNNSLRIILGCGIALLIFLAIFILIQVKTPHNNLFTGEIERHYFLRYGDECEFKIENEKQDDYVVVQATNCDYDGVISIYDKNEKTDDFAAAIAPKIFEDYKEAISAATNQQTDEVSYASYAIIDKMEWGHIPDIRDVLSYTTLLSFRLEDINENKAIVQQVDDFIRQNFRLSVLSSDGSNEYALTVMLTFKDKMVQLIPKSNKVFVLDVDAKEEDEPAEYSYEAYFK